MKFHSKGQAALEFLTTYGWAFLVILVVIGGLSYFGVFDIGRVLPDGCRLDNSIECGDIFVINQDGTDYDVQFEVRNNRDKRITITDLRLIERSLADSADAVTECTDTVEGTSVAIAPGETAALDFQALTGAADCGLADNVDQKKTFEIEVDFTVQGSSINLVSRGEITTTVIG